MTMPIYDRGVFRFINGKLTENARIIDISFKNQSVSNKSTL